MVISKNGRKKKINKVYMSEDIKGAYLKGIEIIRTFGILFSILFLERVATRLVSYPSLDNAYNISNLLTL
jgi:hypothetical protein